MIYIKKEDMPSWIAKYFIKDLISLDDIFEVIEELQYELDKYAEDSLEEEEII